MLKNRKSSFLNNEKGMAVFEMIPIIVVMILFLNFSIGFFGAIHTGILNSIASRNYAFETFRNRADLTYFRMGNSSDIYIKEKVRVHGTISDKEAGKNSTTPEFKATSRLIDFMAFQNRAADIVGTQADHSKTRSVPEGRNINVGVNPIWIKTTYGICLDSTCGT